MKEAAWNNLVSRYPEVSGLAVGDIYGILKPYQTVLRSSYKKLTVSQVQSMSNISIRQKTSDGFLGHSTINHIYESKSINGDKVVIDHATGLMWYQSDAEGVLGLDRAKAWVRSLSRGYAGYHDWRLPTVEEAASLLESSKNAGNLYIDTVFDVTQSGIWTGDEEDNLLESRLSIDGSEAAWLVDFRSGYVKKVISRIRSFSSSLLPAENLSRYHVWPVRSINREPKPATDKRFIKDKKKYQVARESLRDLKTLKKKGNISERQYEIRRKKILNSF
jgi:hypothetical protein